MNVLLFVTTMIMVLSMLTYAKMQTYRNFSILQAEFNRYIMESERGYINNGALWWYENSRATVRGPNQNKSQKGGARSRLSFIVFIDKSKQAAYAQAYPQILLLSKKLMYNLYHDQPFFQQVEQQRPDILDALLASLMVADSLPKDQKPKKAADLSNLDLGDPLLNSVFYFMLKGAPAPEAIQPVQQTAQPPSLLSEYQAVQGNAEADDENGDPNKKEEYKSPEGYYSLLDYIILEDTVKIRVFLAPRALLTAIFDDPNVVEAIIELRNNLYNQVVNGSMNAANASTQFQTMAAPRTTFDQTILDFTVTKTNPRNYE